MGVMGEVRKRWAGIDPRFLPFADIATADVPLSRFFRLAMFQLSVGMVQTLFFGTLNRVMIVELHVPAMLVALFTAIPLLIAPFRTLIGFKSDTHRSIMGWRRVPYLWMGTLLQWSGLAIMPFALLVLSDPAVTTSRWIGALGAGLAFFMVGMGSHTTQTAGLALASDLAAEDKRPRVVALMYLMLLVGVVVSAFAFGYLLSDYSEIKLIRVVQGAALLTVWINGYSCWQQEPRRRGIVPYAKGERRPLFRDAWRAFVQGGKVIRLLVAVAIGFFAFNLQDVLLEPYGGQILRLTVAQTTALTGLSALGAVLSFAAAAKMLETGYDPIRVAAIGGVAGMLAICAVLLSSAFGAVWMFRVGAFGIGFGEAMFGVGTLSYAMALKDEAQHGMALGAWGAVFAAGEGLGLALSGAMKDGVARLMMDGNAVSGTVGRPELIGYNSVYVLEVLALVVTLAALGPLARAAASSRERPTGRFGLVDLPS
jgi:BCD family chlorophyll transporter-like MFS transporter